MVSGNIEHRGYNECTSIEHLTWAALPCKVGHCDARGRSFSSKSGQQTVAAWRRAHISTSLANCGLRFRIETRTSLSLSVPHQARLGRGLSRMQVLQVDEATACRWNAPASC